jgi:glycosyltransferase involved in cell wall biosynthesis
VLEIGWGDGGFVAMMRSAGFNAVGMDLNPSPSLDSGVLAKDGLDAIVLINALEDLGDPFRLLQHCSSALQENGVFFLQTPRYREGRTLEEMRTGDDPFLQVLGSDKHSYLFSKSSIELLFQKLGLPHVNFEPDGWSKIHMEIVASSARIASYSEEEATARLLSEAASREIVALIDIHRKFQSLNLSLDRQSRELDAQNQRVRELERTGEIFSTQRSNLLRELADAKTRVSVADKKLAAHVDVLSRMHHSYVYRLLRFFGLWEWVTVQEIVAPKNGSRSSPRTKRSLKRVVVDLVPVLAGGENGGAKIMTLELVRLLGQMASYCEFILLTTGRNHDELAPLECNTVRRHCVDNRGESGSRTGILRSLNADLLFCPFTLPTFYDPTVPVVSVVYDLQYLYYPEFFSANEVQERDRNFRQVIRAGARIVCISEFVRKTVLENTTLSPERVETIHIMLPRRLRKTSAPSRDTILRKLHLQPGRFLIYPANFWRHKNHELLVTAFGMYKAANPDSDLKLVLTGSPNERQKLLVEAVDRMGLADTVEFPGYVSNDEVSELIDSCFGLIFPSLYEGFGMPLLEAMAAGIPVLSSNVASLPEVGGDAVLFFDPRKPKEIADAISRLEREPELRRGLREKGMEHLLTFGGPKQMVGRYMNVFHEAINDPIELPEGLYGTFVDGWLEEGAQIAYAAGPEQRHIALTLELPAWVPLEKVSVYCTMNGRESELYEIQRGQTLAITVGVGEDPGLVDFWCSPAFRPKTSGLGDDCRLLTCRCVSAEIVGRGVKTALESKGYVL